MKKYHFYDGFSSNKGYGYIFIPSGSFSLITDKNEINKNIKTEELFNVKHYKPTEFENYLQGTSLKIENKYINNEKEKYVGQRTDRIIYEIAKK
jgi:hypothetical protein